MEENERSVRNGHPQKEVQELIDRCEDMEKELSELKQRMLEIQRQVEGEMRRRRPSGP
jgi:hypothetical protein